jgi:hypothetical protein
MQALHAFSPPNVLLRILVLAANITGIMPFHATVSAESLCGVYATLPNSSVRYEYIPGMVNPVVLPLVAQLTFGCDDPTTLLTARLDTPIIGVDENGNVIFPIGGQFPMTVHGQSADGRQFTGSLLKAPYLFSWEFERTPSGDLLWNGFVTWSGGRYEHTTISNVNVRQIPEPTLLLGKWIVFLMVAGAMRNGGKGLSQKTLFGYLTRIQETA